MRLDLQTPGSDSYCGSLCDSLDGDETFPIVPVAYLDARRYLYSNGDEVLDGAIKIQLSRMVSSRQVLEMEINSNDVVLSAANHGTTNLQLIGKFGGEMTVTRIGIRAKVEYEYSSLVKMKTEVQARMGEIGECSDVKKLYEHTFYPLPYHKVAYIDHAKTICSHLPQDFCLELKVVGCGRAILRSCTVCARFQGGRVCSVDDGEDMVVRRLSWK